MPGDVRDDGIDLQIAGLHRLRAGEQGGRAIEVRARWPLSELRPPGRSAVGVADELP